MVSAGAAAGPGGRSEVGVVGEGGSGGWDQDGCASVGVHGGEDMAIEVAQDCVGGAQECNDAASVNNDEEEESVEDKEEQCFTTGGLDRHAIPEHAHIKAGPAGEVEAGDINKVPSDSALPPSQHWQQRQPMKRTKMPNRHARSPQSESSHEYVCVFVRSSDVSGAGSGAGIGAASASASGAAIGAASGAIGHEKGGEPADILPVLVPCDAEAMQVDAGMQFDGGMQFDKPPDAAQTFDRPSNDPHTPTPSLPQQTPLMNAERARHEGLTSASAVPSHSQPMHPQHVGRTGRIGRNGGLGVVEDSDWRWTGGAAPSQWPQRVHDDSFGVCV